MSDEIPLVLDATHWLDRAAEARTMADQMDDATAREQMIEIARGYLRLAERAETRKREHERGI